jgi:putative FmdB family regulatory protein
VVGIPGPPEGKEAAMPMYDFVCRKCGKEFAEIMPVSELDKRQVACPACGSTDVQHIVTSVHTITKKKS